MSWSIDAVLQAAVDSSAVPNVVGVAADNGGVIYEGAAGPRAVGADEQVGADSTFRIASMTKIACTVAALQQRERANLDFDAPVDDYCPDFAAVPVLDGFEDGRPRLRAPASRATVKQLVTHTAGLAYSFWNADIVRWEAAGGAANAPGGLTGTFAGPMVADPGTRLEYGISTDWLGRVVEAASGKSLDDYLTEHVFAPLGMRSTAFLLNDEQRARCVPVHVRDGGWSSDFVAGPGRKWGWGLLLNTRDEPGMRAAGSGGWAGMFNTSFWVDPHTKVTGALYTQTLPFVTPEALRMSADFERALYASYEGARGSGIPALTISDVRDPAAATGATG